MNQNINGRAVITHEQIFEMVKAGEPDLLLKCTMVVRDALIDEVMVFTRGEITAAAKLLGIQRGTLRTYLKAKGQPIKAPLRPNIK